MSDYEMKVGSSDSRSWVITGSEWEQKVGYSRAVKTGNLIFVSGTVGKNVDGSLPEGLVDQAKNSLAIISAALGKLGSSLEEIVKLNIFLKDITQWDRIASLVKESIGNAKPACCISQMSKGIDEAVVIEIQVDAVTTQH
jgi:enamine deaminase RidA (YjgF/YER057c/UK114 family)